MTATVEAGSLVQVECPVSPEVVPHQQIGAGISAENGTKSQPDFVVVSVEGKTILLGPLRPGKLAGSFECAPGQVVAYEFEVQPTDPPPQPQAPEIFVNLAWPLWFLVVVPLVAAVALFGLGRFLYRRHQERKQKPKPTPSKPALPADVRLRSFVRDLKARKLLFRQKGVELEETLSQSVVLLRQFLEYRFGFEAKAATSSEFLGELKVATLQKIRNPEEARKVLQPVESIFVFTDRVRYSKENPNETQLKDLETQLMELLGLMREESA